MRQSPETSKVDCRIIDLVESLTHVDGVISVPTLFGLDPSEVIDGTILPRCSEVELNINRTDEDIQELKKRAETSIPDTESKNDVPDPKSVTYIDYENPFALVYQCSGAPHIAKISRFAWVGCGGDVYVLECLGKGTIRIEPFGSNEGGRLQAFQVYY
jgi:ATP-dependent helicase IRC3